MSIAARFLHQLYAPLRIFQTVLSTTIGTGLTTIKGIAFWATIPLPLVIVGTLLTGLASAMPRLLVDLVVLNILCAAFGHTHTPETRR